MLELAAGDEHQRVLGVGPLVGGDDVGGDEACLAAFARERLDEDDRVTRIAFVPFCYYEAAINRLTNAALEPFAKIPEFKYCAVRLSLGGTLAPQTSFGGGQALRELAETAPG